MKKFFERKQWLIKEEEDRLCAKLAQSSNFSKGGCVKWE